MSSRRVFGVGAALACALALAGLPAAAAAVTAPAPRDQLRSFLCQKAFDPPTRAVSVQAVVRPLTGTSTMQVRFELLRRTKPGGLFRLVRGRLLGSWISPHDPTLGRRAGDIWIVNHPVVDLAAPATYRFRVSFRWIGSDGQQLGSAVLTSPTCYQPELRADLRVRSLTVTPLSSGQDAYIAVIANRGLTAAGPVEVDLAGIGIGTGAGAGAGAPAVGTVPAVGAGATASYRFTGPACTAGSTLTVTVDPAHTVDEFNFANNVLTVPCPAPISG